MSGPDYPTPGTPFRLPLEQLRLQPNLPAGMNILRIAAIADHLRNAGGDIREPVLVERVGPGDWVVRDGRHRFVASYVAGVRDLLCVEKPRRAAT